MSLLCFTIVLAKFWIQSMKTARNFQIIHAKFLVKRTRICLQMNCEILPCGSTTVTFVKLPEANYTSVMLLSVGMFLLILTLWVTILNMFFFKPKSKWMTVVFVLHNCFLTVSGVNHTDGDLSLSSSQYAARSGVTRGLNQGGNLAERGAVVTAGDPLVNTQRQF